MSADESVASSPKARSGQRWAGRFWLFRYEIRRCHGGTIPDANEAVSSPVRVADDLARAQGVLDAVPFLLQRLPHPSLGHLRRYDRAQDPEAHRRRLLPLVVVLAVADVLAPLDVAFAHRQVGHESGRVWRRVIATRLRGVDDVAGTDGGDGVTAGLDAPLAFGHKTASG
jgi:hypothetical protein